MPQHGVNREALSLSVPATIWMAIAGNANDRAQWSGTAAHLIESAGSEGLAFDGLVLDRPGERLRRAWNLMRLLRTGKVGGFQYSSLFLDRLWRGQPLAGRTIMSCYQVLPDRVIDAPDLARWYYVDGTLTQLWASADYTPRPLPPSVVEETLVRERRGYHAAAGVICHSRWAADSVVADYGVSPERVHVVVPGANLEPDSYGRWHGQPRPPTPGGPLRLVFVGMGGMRKGLDRLIEAMPIARAGGATLTLTVIGCPPDALPAPLAATAGVEWLGQIDKRRDADRFVAAVAGAEVGCLLSRAEFGGMAQREYAALGLAAIGPAVDGAPEHAGPGALLVAADATPADIAALLVDLARRGDAYHRLRDAAWAARDEASWANAARRLHAIVNG
ncbi:MAG: hypothetical protein JWN21_2305 [Sphingomonas bacterium]|uniref:glycosyltransferase family 4 protein n=1 Tax=Sphingomonas bacterium TaxID=1895847 RepID=UPI00263255D8|nr:glycosyltransferase family 4 protein [Sphingomonas bacterium]MDB5696762.1 hypothetical protein [Sphingomonas bacterium]